YHLTSYLFLFIAQPSPKFTLFPYTTLFRSLKECRSYRTLRSFELKFEKYDLVIIDELGYISFDKEGAELLFTHLSLRAGRKSTRSEEHTSELQSRFDLVCRLLLEKKKKIDH